MLHFRDHDDRKYKIYNRGVGLELFFDGRGWYYCRDKPSVDARAATSGLQRYRLLTQSLWELAEGNTIGSSVLYLERKLTLSCGTDRTGSPRSSDATTDNFGGVARQTLNLRHTVGERAGRLSASNCTDWLIHRRQVRIVLARTCIRRRIILIGSNAATPQCCTCPRLRTQPPLWALIMPTGKLPLL